MRIPVQTEDSEKAFHSLVVERECHLTMGTEFGKKEIRKARRREYKTLLDEIKGFYHALKQWEQIDVKCAKWFWHGLINCTNCDWGEYCRDCIIIHMKAALITLEDWLRDWIKRVKQGEGKTVYSSLIKEFEDWGSKYYQNVYLTGFKGSNFYSDCPLYIMEGNTEIMDWRSSLCMTWSEKDWGEIASPGVMQIML